MIIDKCPHCGTAHVQTEPRYSEAFDPGQGHRTWDIERCQNEACRKLILLTVHQGRIERVHPPVTYELDPLIVVDAQIRSDFEEAGLCLGAGCAKASMVMSRRTLQRILKEQGCTQNRLVEAIDHAIQSGILRGQFHPIATEIRQYGNLGAHPDDDQLDNATTENAQQILEFVRVLLNEFYELPAKAESLRKSREEGSGAVSPDSS